MLFLNLLSNPVVFIGFLIALLVAISVHETAHAWMADKLGDSTAKENGRLTLNPFAHLDLFGTIFLLLAGFGWGKPVPINPHNLKNPKLDELFIALAGPISNLLTAILFLLIIRFIPVDETLTTIFLLIAQINIVLMVFNLFPIPPLDGSTLLKVILPEDSFQAIARLGIPLLFVFLIFSQTTNFLSTVINIVTNFFFEIFLR